MNIVPPGLCCAVCTLPFQRALARRTPTGYVHARPCTSPVDLTDRPGVWMNLRGVMRWVAAA